MKTFNEYITEMDKSQTPPGRDGSNDEGGKKEYPAKIITPKKAVKDGEKILNKIFNKNKLDEVSKSTLRKYVNKARSDRMDALHSNYRNTDDDYEAAKKDNERVEKRDRGINLARAKINKFGKSGNTIAKVKATEEVELEETAAWQRKEGKSESGGLNQKGVDSYRRENPGSKLKTAVTTKPSKLKAGSAAANRRKSFCARMSGMKKRLTSAKTANDPDSRINKSLRKWNC